VTKPVALRAAAKRDAERIACDYVDQAGVDVVFRFVDALENANRFIGDNQRAGSPLHGLVLDIPGLRSWRFPGFLYLISTSSASTCWTCGASTWKP
jgi:plasmid stabilization system protein ParE